MRFYFLQGASTFEIFCHLQSGYRSYATVETLEERQRMSPLALDYANRICKASEHITWIDILAMTRLLT